MLNRYLMGIMAFCGDLHGHYLCPVFFQDRDRHGLIDEKKATKKQGGETNIKKSGSVHREKRALLKIIGKRYAKLLFLLLCTVRIVKRFDVIPFFLQYLFVFKQHFLLIDQNFPFVYNQNDVLCMWKSNAMIPG